MILVTFFLVVATKLMGHTMSCNSGLHTQIVAGLSHTGDSATYKLGHVISCNFDLAGLGGPFYAVAFYDLLTYVCMEL